MEIKRVFDFDRVLLLYFLFFNGFIIIATVTISIAIMNGG